jgi:hypothetical protein
MVACGVYEYRLLSSLASEQGFEHYSSFTFARITASNPTFAHIIASNPTTHCTKARIGTATCVDLPCFKRNLYHPICTLRESVYFVRYRLQKESGTPSHHAAGFNSQEKVEVERSYEQIHGRDCR